MSHRSLASHPQLPAAVAAAVLVVLALATSVLVARPAGGSPPAPATPAALPGDVRVRPSATGGQRLAGPDRFATAARVAAASHPDGAEHVLLARGDVATDALAAAPLSDALDAPILLTRTDRLPDATAAALRTLGARRVWVLGGTAAVADGVLDAVRDLGDGCCEVARVRGADRYATATAAARATVAAGGPARTAVVVTGRDFPDALAAGGVASRDRLVLLVEPDTVPSPVAALLDELALDRVAVVGGRGAVSDRVFAQVEARAGEVTRVAGSDRTATATAVAALLGPAAPTRVLLARGDDPADALAAAPLARSLGAPVLLARNREQLGDATARYLAGLASSPDVTAIGGTASIRPGVLATAAAAAGAVDPADVCAAVVAAGMTLPERAGGVLMTAVVPGHPLDQVDAHVRVHHVGGVLLAGRWRGGADQVRAQVTHLQRVAVAGRALLVAADQEGGAVQGLSGPGFERIPSAVVQGRTDPVDLEAAARRWGAQLRAAGVLLNLAPVLGTVPADVGRANEPIGRSNRQFGADPTVVASAGAAFLRGIRAGGTFVAAKHFPGLGRADGNTDTRAGVTDPTGPDDPYLAPFAAAVEHGADVVMVSSATYPAIDPTRRAVFSPVVISDLLRGRLGFDGIVMTDDVGAAAELAAVPVGERAVRHVAAGGDLVLSVRPRDVAALHGALVRAAQSDPEFAGRLDEAARRVLALRTGVPGFSCD